MPKVAEKAVEKADVSYCIEYSQLNGRDTNVFIATEFEVLDNGFIKASGTFKRRKKASVLLIPISSVVCIEEQEGGAEEPAADTV